MNEKEIILFRQLCTFKSNYFDDSVLDYATPNVLGHLFFNRMAAVAYGVLKTHDLLGNINREFRTSIRGAYVQNIERNKSYFSCLKYVSELLSDVKAKYAFLKGALLCYIYPKGYRTSNDIDILVAPEDVSLIGEILLENGFIQGNIKNDVFIPATRKEIIESKMMRGETVPYIKKVDLPGLKYVEIDINFSLDYKTNEDTILYEVLNNTVYKEIDDFRIKTLNDFDFIIHLCSHLYKEATTLPWIKMKRDMSLYKYCDIYMLLDSMTDVEKNILYERSTNLGLDKILGFAIIQVSELFETEEDSLYLLSKKSFADDENFLHKVIAPSDKQILQYREKNLINRFFENDRLSLLEVIYENEKT